MATDWDVQDLGRILGNNIRDNQNQSQNFVTSEEVGAITLGMLHAVNVSTTTKIYKQDIGNHFTLDHPVNCNLDSSTLQLDTGLGTRTLFSSVIE